MTKFTPGQSGNPGGRPKACEHVRGLIAKQGDKIVAGLIKIALDTKEDPKARIMAKRELLDRWLGKAPQQFDDGKGGPLVVKLVQFGTEAD